MRVIRSLAAVCFAAMLSACAPVIAPPGPAPTTPELQGEFFVTTDGLRLPVRRWLPEGQPSAVIVGLHGFNDYAKAFDTAPGVAGTGPELAKHGFAVFAYDQRGFGKAPNVGLWPGEDALVGDFRDFAHVLRAAYPGVPLFALGESMGGAVIMSAVAKAQSPPVDGVILAAPAVWARSTMPFYYRAGLWLGARLLPGLKPTGQNLGRRASDNIDLLRDNARDPLFIKDTRLDTIYGLTNLMDDALAASGKIGVPTLYLYGHNDQIIPPGPTRRAMAALTAANPKAVTAVYPEGWHIVLRDKQAAKVLADVAAFIARPDAPLPSGSHDGAIARVKALKAR
ncbi:MAG: alpha/beta hydrolase [Rhodospirillaceae bacterium]|nr:alpha/beta hydrolase [Rhodospirillaceae bacterium]